VAQADREVIVRLRNCIAILAKCQIMIYDTTVLKAFESSLTYEVNIDFCIVLVLFYTFLAERTDTT